MVFKKIDESHVPFPGLQGGLCVLAFGFHFGRPLVLRLLKTSHLINLFWGVKFDATEVHPSRTSVSIRGSYRQNGVLLWSRRAWTRSQFTIQFVGEDLAVPGLDVPVYLRLLQLFAAELNFQLS